MPISSTDDRTGLLAGSITGSDPEDDIFFILAESQDCRLEGSEVGETVLGGVAFGVIEATETGVAGWEVSPAVKRECEGEEDEKEKQ
jgi:hypothetical protein